jgi:hypothetical protein
MHLAFVMAVSGEINGAGGERQIILPKSIFEHLVKAAIERVVVDEKWYLETYSDVRDAVSRKKIASAAEHYLHFGYFENRMPYPISVDEAYYLKEYPDVAIKIKEGVFRNGQEHFDKSGFTEGRLPKAGFSLLF